MRAPSLCSTANFPESPETWPLEMRAGIPSTWKPRTWVLPASPYMLFIPHACSHTDTGSVQRNFQLGLEKGMYTETRNSQKTNSGWLRSQGQKVPGVIHTRVHTQSPLTNHPAAQLFSRNHPLSGQGVSWQDSKGRG